MKHKCEQVQFVRIRIVTLIIAEMSLRCYWFSANSCTYRFTFCEITSRCHDFNTFRVIVLKFSRTMHLHIVLVKPLNCYVKTSDLIPLYFWAPSS